MPHPKPEKYIQYLGKTFIDSITARGTHAALIIGVDEWSRHELAADLGVVHTRAASILTGIAKDLGVRSTADLFERTSPYSLVGYPCGVTTLFVMFAAFIAKDLDPNKWYAKGHAEAVVSFISLKHRELQAEARTKAEERKRQRRKRASKHARAVAEVLKNGTKVVLAAWSMLAMSV